MNVVVTTPARLDLDEIARYITADDVDRAVSFVSELLDQCHTLSDFPKAYPIIPRYKRQGVRRRVHGNYLILSGSPETGRGSASDPRSQRLRTLPLPR